MLACPHTHTHKHTHTHTHTTHTHTHAHTHTCLLYGSMAAVVQTVFVTAAVVQTIKKVPCAYIA